MNAGKYIFSQLVSFLPKRVFDGIVKRHEGDKRVKHFTCWNQLLVIMFGQLAGCDSLREVAALIDAIKSKSYHLGFGSGDIKLSNMSYASANRNYKIFEEFAYYMIDLALSKRITRQFELNGKFYAFDSTTIDLCMSLWTSDHTHLKTSKPVPSQKKIKERIFSYGREYYVEYTSRDDLRYQFYKDMVFYFK